jgi:hypothetical protein
MADDQHDYKVAPGRPPLHTRFRKGAVRQPRRPQQKEAARAAGRVLGVTALGPDLGGAREHAYTAVDRIAWPKDFCRRALNSLVDAKILRKSGSWAARRPKSLL